MSWRLDCKRPVMWPRCKPNRSQSFKVRLSERSKIRQLEEVLDQHLSPEWMLSVPIASWTPGYWVVLNTLKVSPERGETGVLPSEHMRRLVSLDWSN